jgi:hypothetical protein
VAALWSRFAGVLDHGIPRREVVSPKSMSPE